jgi:hypothetical protein
MRSRPALTVAHGPSLGKLCRGNICWETCGLGRLGRLGADRHKLSERRNGTLHFMTYGDPQLVIKLIPVVCSGLFSVDEWFPNWGTEFPGEALRHNNK